MAQTAETQLSLPRVSKNFLNKYFCLLYALMTISETLIFKNIVFTSYGCFNESVDLLMLPFQKYFLIF